MKSITILALFVFANCASQEKSSKSSYTLKINNVEYKVFEGEALKLNIKLDNPTVSIKSNDKEFSNEFISFNYPNNFSEEIANDEGYKSWTLDGDNYVATIYELDLEDGLEPFVQEIVNNFGEQNCSVKETTLKLGAKTLKGKKINVSLVSQKLTIDFLSIPATDGKTRLISFQDSLDDNGAVSEESKTTIKKINDTVTFK